MIRAVRTVWAARLATLAVLLGLLMQPTLVAPAALRMAAAPICTAAPAGGQATPGGDTPDRPAHDHAHCLICHAPLGPPLLATAALLAIPQGHAAPPASAAPARIVPAERVTFFRSRAPPTLA